MLKKDNFINEINFLLKKMKIKRNDNLLIHSNSAGINQIQKNKKNKPILQSIYRYPSKKNWKKRYLSHANI